MSGRGRGPADAAADAAMIADGDRPAVRRTSWVPSTGLRWFRPVGGTDNDLRLQQLFERRTGEQEWIDVPTVLAG